MLPFDYAKAKNENDAMDRVRAPKAAFVAGGTTLIDLMKLNLMLPAMLVDINGLPLDKIESLPDGGLRIGAMVRNSDMAHHAEVIKRFPVLSQAVLSGASPQLRNMATAGGNLMQRTRCYYFMDPAFPSCNKRLPGSGCPAISGENRIHAILGASKACIAVHPSDMCVALAALDAVVQVEGPRGGRTISMQTFHRLPGDTPHVDTNLIPNELILAIDLPSSPFGHHVEYLKIRDRQSFAFALVSCAAALDI